jgi:hypothetical protein
MSRNQTYDVYDIIADIMINMLVLLSRILLSIAWAAIVIPIALIIRTSKKTPEEELREASADFSWGRKIDSVRCQNCLTANELGSDFCYFCGLPFNNRNLKTRKIEIDIKHVLSGLVVLIFVVLWIVLLYIIF